MAQPDGERLTRVEVLQEGLTKNIESLVESIRDIFISREEGWKEFRESIQECSKTLATLVARQNQCNHNGERNIPMQAFKTAVISCGVQAVFFGILGLVYLLFKHGFVPLGGGG